MNYSRLLRDNPKLRKEPFRNFIVTYQKKTHPVSEELSAFLGPQLKSIAAVRANLFRANANKGFWKKVLGYNEPERFKMKPKDKFEKKALRQEAQVDFEHFFDERFPKSLRRHLADKDILIEMRAKSLHEYLVGERKRLRKAGQDTRAVSQTLVDLIHGIAYHDSLVIEGFNSSNGLERLMSLEKVLAERDNFAYKLGYTGFDDLLKKMNIAEPTGMSHSSRLFEKIEMLRETIIANLTSAPISSKTIRHLSLTEAPFRSCLGGDCSTRTYFSKALDPNFHYFTLTDKEGKSSGHITVVLGDARTIRLQKRKVAFVDKVQNISNEDLPFVMEGVRRSVEENGYVLAVPDSLGDVLNGITNQDKTRNFIRDNIRRNRQRLIMFTPHRNLYKEHFSNRHSQAYNQRLHFVRPVMPLQFYEEVTVNPGDLTAPYKIADFDFKKLLKEVIELKNGDLDDRLRYIHIMEQLSGKVAIDPEYRDILWRWIRDETVPFRLKKQAVLTIWETENSLEKPLTYLSNQDIIVLLQNILDTPRYQKRLLLQGAKNEFILEFSKIKKMILSPHFINSANVAEAFIFASKTKAALAEEFTQLMMHISDNINSENFPDVLRTSLIKGVDLEIILNHLMNRFPDNMSVQAFKDIFLRALYINADRKILEQLLNRFPNNMGVRGREIIFLAALEQRVDREILKQLVEHFPHEVDSYKFSYFSDRIFDYFGGKKTKDYKELMQTIKKRRYKWFYRFF